MPSITDRAGRVLARGNNLGCILKFARKHPVEVIRVERSWRGEGQLTVTFYFEPESLAAQALTTWADWRVLLDWLHSRRSWDALHRVRFIMDAKAFEEVDKHPITAKLRARGITVCPFIPNHPSIT